MCLVVLAAIVVVVRRRRRGSAGVSQEWSMSTEANHSSDTSSDSASEATPGLAAGAALESENLLRDVKIGKVLGEGQFGKVYKGRHNGQDVAVKQISQTDAGSHAEFLQELEMLTTVRSPYIVEFVGVALLKDDSIGLVMEFCAGGSLDTMLVDSGPELDERGLIQICLHLAKGIEAVHSASILHRDLACRNVLVTSTGACKLADFGLARSVAAEGTY
jgi:serine/threonine protein kinase